MFRKFYFARNCEKRLLNVRKGRSLSFPSHSLSQINGDVTMVSSFPSASGCHRPRRPPRHRRRRRRRRYALWIEVHKKKRMGGESYGSHINNTHDGKCSILDPIELLPSAAAEIEREGEILRFPFSRITTSYTRFSNSI
jgi:hypothetical protein